MMSQLKYFINWTLVAQLGFVVFASGASTSESVSSSLAVLDSPALKIVSDEDSQSMQQIKYHMDNEYAKFKNIDDVVNFLEKVRTLVQKHPKNTAFAQGDLKDLLKFLSQESVIRLIRVDTDPFYPIPFGEDKIALAQRALEEDELTRKLFEGPIRSLIEARRQQLSRAEDGNHKDGNFFTNFWCKISGGCHQ